MRIRLLLGLAAIIAMVLAGACGDDSSSSGDGGTDTDTDTDTDSDADGDAGIGEFCDMNIDCASKFCHAYQHVPIDPDGECREGLPAGQISVRANVRDFYTGEYISGVDVKIAGAMTILPNPLGFTPLATETTDADGRISVDMDVDGVPVGIVAAVEETDYHLSLNGLAAPELAGSVYPAGVTNRDIKLISNQLLEDWSTMLEASDSSLSPYLPLGEKGGVIGSIRHVEDGSGVEGATLESQDSASLARIYYLNEDEDAFVTTETSSNGYFVLFGPGLAEKFDAVIGSEVVSRLPCTVGETQQAVYSTTVHVEGMAD